MLVPGPHPVCASQYQHVLGKILPDVPGDRSIGAEQARLVEGVALVAELIVVVRIATDQRRITPEEHIEGVLELAEIASIGRHRHGRVRQIGPFAVVARAREESQFRVSHLARRGTPKERHSLIRHLDVVRGVIERRVEHHVQARAVGLPDEVLKFQPGVGFRIVGAHEG